jgi:hypothetical protein
MYDMEEYYKLLYKWFMKVGPTATSHLLALMPDVLEYQLLILPRGKDIRITLVGSLAILPR